MIRTLLILILALVITACGYSLRGNDVLSSQFESLQLDMQQPNSEFARLLRRSLEVSDVQVQLTTAANASDSPILAVSDERVVSRPVTVNPRARAAQYEMRMSVTIALGREDDFLISPETLLVERTYFEDIENISGTQEEVEIISAEIAQSGITSLILSILFLQFQQFFLME